MIPHTQKTDAEDARMTFPVDPVSTAIAPFHATNAVLNIAVNAMTIGERLSLVSNAKPFEVTTHLAGFSSSETMTARLGDRSVQLRLAREAGRKFVTFLEYRRYCRVAGVRCVRQYVTFELSGYVAPYVVVDDGELHGQIGRRPGGLHLGFHDVFLELGDPIDSSKRDHPYDFFNEETSLTFEARFDVNDGFLKISWLSWCGGFAPGGAPAALTKRMNGTLRLSTEGVLSPIGENSMKYFTIYPHLQPAPIELRLADAAPPRLAPRPLGPPPPRTGERRAPAKGQAVSAGRDPGEGEGENEGAAAPARRGVPMKNTRKRIAGLFRRGNRDR